MYQLSKFTRDELIIEAETLEEYGEYLHTELIGYSPKELRSAATMFSHPSSKITTTKITAYARKEE